MKKTIILLIGLLAFSTMQAQVIFDNSYGGTEVDYGLSVTESINNEYIAVGSTESYGNFNDIFIVKSDSNGDTIWTKSYGGYHFDEATDIIQLSDTSYLISGISLSYSNGYGSAYLMSINENGDSLWGKVYSCSTNQKNVYLDQTANCIKALDSSSFLVGGSRIVNGTKTSPFLMKVDVYGDTLWTKVFDTNNGYFPIRSIAVSNNLEVFFLACENSLIITDSTGTLLNIKEIKSNSVLSKNDSLLFSLGDSLHILNTNGEFIESYNYYGELIANSYNDDIVILSNNEIQIIDTTMILINTTSADNGKNLISTSDSALLLVGGISDLEMKKFRYPQPTNIRKITTHNHSIIYPNPFKDYLTINVTNGSDIKIYNENGKLLIFRKNDTKVNVSSLPSGIYFIQIKTESGVYNNKMIKM